MDRMVMASQQIVPLIRRSKQLYLHAVTNTFDRKDGRGAVQPFVLHRGRFLSTVMEKKKSVSTLAVKLLKPHPTVIFI